METTLKIAPTVISLGTTVITQIWNYDGKIRTLQRFHQKTKLHQTAVYLMYIISLTQLVRGDYSRMINLSLVTIFMEYAKAGDEDGFIQWLSVVINFVLTYVNW